MIQNHCLNFPEEANAEANGECTWLCALFSCPQRVDMFHGLASSLHLKWQTLGTVSSCRVSKEVHLAGSELWFTHTRRKCVCRQDFHMSSDMQAFWRCTFLELKKLSLKSNLALHEGDTFFSSWVIPVIQNKECLNFYIVFCGIWFTSKLSSSCLLRWLWKKLSYKYRRTFISCTYQWSCYYYLSTYVNVYIFTCIHGSSPFCPSFLSSPFFSNLPLPALCRELTLYLQKLYHWVKTLNLYALKIFFYPKHLHYCLGAWKPIKVIFHNFIFFAIS